MANKTLNLDDGLYAYLHRVSLREPAVLRQLREVTEQEREHASMRSAPEQGQFMAMLLGLIGARRVIEVGK